MKDEKHTNTLNADLSVHSEGETSAKHARFDHRAIEAKWAKIWKDTKINEASITSAKKPFYNLMMFPYPSAEGLHVGNMYAFTGSDIFGRYMRMRGYDVFEPIGLDGFGIHSENFALKIGRHPMDHAAITEKNFYAQLSKIGAMFDWSRTVETYNPNYYRWTQWLFVQMFKQGLAYRAKANVNYCPSCKTVLADEQVIDGVCERCKSIAEKKALEQWFFRITSYAEKLLGNLDGMDWTEKVKIAQKNWIGKKEGIEIHYSVKDTKEEIVCFTTAPVNFGMTFIVISPEHSFVQKILRGEVTVSKEKAKKIAAYVESCAKRKKEIGEKEKTGVDTGLLATNRVAGWDVPIWISDFVVTEVGTGAVQGCPAHDVRDFEFAQKFGLPIKRVVVGEDGDMSSVDLPEKVIVHGMKGTMVNSEFLNGLPFEQGLQATMDFVEKNGWGKRVSTYHLRDWLISRQRYWGPPIPMIFCQSCAEEGKNWCITKKASEVSFPPRIKVRDKLQRESSISALDPRVREGDNGMAGWYPVPEKDLPVILPRIEDYKPGDDGVAPLAKHAEFYNVLCPSCGAKAKRETDVSDTFLDSSWYFLRYPSVAQEEALLADENILDTQRVGPRNLDNSISKIDNKSTNINSTKLGERSSNILSARDAQRVSSRPSDIPWDSAITKKWLPVHMYTGGAEHSVLHLLYSRFVTMMLHDLGLVEFDEPFSTFFAHGLVIKDGSKMSKSKGNVVNPDEYIATYGADALRIYLMFMGPFSQGGDFRDSAMEGVSRWLNRVWKIVTHSISLPAQAGNTQNPIHNTEGSEANKVQKALNKLVKKVGEDMEHRRYNTAIASMMEFTNLVADEGGVLAVEEAQVLVKLLAPLAPHLAEEMWEMVNKRLETGSYLKTYSSSVSEKFSPPTGGSNNTDFRGFEMSSRDWRLEDSVHVRPWPEFDASILAEDEVTVAVQIHGKTRATIATKLSVIKEESAFISLCHSDTRVKKYLDGKKIVKTIVVPGKLVNFVIG